MKKNLRISIDAEKVKEIAVAPAGGFFPASRAFLGYFVAMI
ncbi:MAG: hypothetical protein WCH57_00265 [Verrucomicrobiota bacterium]